LIHGLLDQEKDQKIENARHAGVAEQQEKKRKGKMEAKKREEREKRKEEQAGKEPTK
jgi:hypothetical protein